MFFKEKSLFFIARFLLLERDYLPQFGNCCREISCEANDFEVKKFGVV